MATKYQVLIDKCKKHFKEGDLKHAWKYYCDINDLLLKRLAKYNKYDEENRKRIYQEYHDYMQQLSDNEVYKITDYGKEQYYIKNGYIKL